MEKETELKIAWFTMGLFIGALIMGLAIGVYG